MTWNAQVRNGRLVLDEPTDLPEGKVVRLETSEPFVIETEDEWDASDEERARVMASYEASRADSLAGRGIDAFEMIRELRARSAARAK